MNGNRAGNSLQAGGGGHNFCVLDVKPIWVQDKEETIWAAVLDHFTPDEDLAIYGLDLWFSTKTYGKDWVAWSKQPTVNQMKSVHLDGKRYMFGDKGEKL